MEREKKVNHKKLTLAGSHTVWWYNFKAYHIPLKYQKGVLIEVYSVWL